MKRIGFVFLVVLLAGSHLCSAVDYEIIDLGEIEWSEMIGPWSSLVRVSNLGINDNGWVVGSTEEGPSPDNCGFAWNGSTTDYLVGGGASGACDINNSNQVLGWDAMGPGIFEKVQNPFLPGTYHWQINYLENPREHFSMGSAINDSGHVAGSLFPTPLTNASFWKDGQRYDLAGTPPWHEIAGGFDINNSDQLVGYCGDRAFLWEEGLGMQDLGKLDGHVSAVARGINNAGSCQVVGDSYDQAGQSHAFIWQNDTMAPLADTGCDESWAVRINDNGDVIGGFSTASNSSVCLWQDGVLIDLNTVELSELGWVIERADDINNAGCIVGYGTNPQSQDYHGFVMIPIPEPGTFALLAVGGLILRRNVKPVLTNRSV